MSHGYYPRVSRRKASGRRTVFKALLLGVAAASAVATLQLAGAPAVRAALASSSSATYTATETIPVPPASSYAGSGGGDGWAVAMTATSVYNVFHHASTLQVACHLQGDASPCWSPETITDGSGDNFATSGQPGLWLDQATGKLYVFATRDSDATGGVVCIDTTQAATNTDPFCGFTALTAVGDAPLQSGISGISDPVVAGNRWYAFDYVNGKGVSGSQNTLLCFDLAAFGPCSSQPFSAAIGSGTVTDGAYPPPAVAAIGSQVIVPVTAGGTDELACFDASAGTACSGSWPVPLGFSYDSGNGAPFPMLNASGSVTGLCLPSSGDPCYSLTGATVATPSGLSGAVTPTAGWNGPAFILGPRVYVPDGNQNQVDCYDYSASAQCANFPKTFSNLELLYTVNADPQRPTCIWVNSDGGSGQIQNFDAYTGGACGKGPIRVLASSMVIPTQLCTPLSYSSLQVTSPAPSTYSSATVDFEGGDGNPIASIATKSLDGTGTVSLAGLNLSTSTGLPEFLITLAGEQGTPPSVVVKLTWTGTNDPSCVKPGTTVTGGSTAYHYVALGDSYSSGEGNPPFYPGTNTKTDQCHRSYDAYPELIDQDPALDVASYVSRACSGATSSELEWGYGANSENGQVNHITSKTNLVTIGVGGDDVDFSGVLTRCITGLNTGASSNCKKMWVQGLDGQGESLANRETELISKLGDDVFCYTPTGYYDCQPSLHSIYQDIASRAASGVRIVVLLYPHLFTNDPASSGCHLSGPDGSAARISKANIQWLNQGVDQLDAKIISEVQVAKKAGLNIDYADPRMDWSGTNRNTSPGGHGVCTKQPWINGLILQSTFNWVPVKPSVYSFHPNIAGQNEFYQVVKAKL